MALNDARLKALLVGKALMLRNTVTDEITKISFTKEGQYGSGMSAGTPRRRATSATPRRPAAISGSRRPTRSRTVGSS